MYTWGWNQNSQLGHGDGETRIVPQKVAALQGKIIASTGCGSRFTIAVTEHGSVYTWGRGDDGQLGHGRQGLIPVPRLVEKLEGTKIVRVAARGSHCLALSSDGMVFSWGRGDEGQLGHGRHGSRYSEELVPQRIRVLENDPIKEISCGRQHSVAISHDGTMYTWGCNDDGAIGQGKQQGSLFIPTPVSGMSHVTQVACGSRHTVVVVKDENMHGSRIYSFGWNIYGQLGVGDCDSRFVPTQVVVEAVGSLDETDTMDRSSEEVKQPVPNTQAWDNEVVQVACGYRHSLVILRKRPETQTELWGWGWNRYQQLGALPESTIVTSPAIISTVQNPVCVAGGGRHTLAVTRRSKDGALRLFAWGRGDNGQLGTGELGDFGTPSRVRLAGRDIGAISCGWSHSVAVEILSLDERAVLEEGGMLPNTFIRETKSFVDGVKRKSSGQNNEPQIKFGDSRMPSMAFKAPTDTSRSAAWLRELSEKLSYGNVDAGVAQWLNCLILLLMIVSSLRIRAGMDVELVVGSVVPGATFTVFTSNVLFGLWGDIITRHRRSQGEPNAQVTALPHGLNTVIFFAYTMLILGPVYDKTGDAMLAYRTGLFATFLLGALEVPSLLIVNWMRSTIPRAAMMSSLAGVSLTFISMTFAFQIFETPSLAIVPLIIILVSYAAHVQLPLKIPSGIAALTIGTAIAWGLRANGLDYFQPTAPIPSSTKDAEVYWPKPTFGLVYEAILDPFSWQYITVVIPMLMVNIVSNLSCVESAATVGDHYATAPALLGDALMTMFGALFGNPFPTCIYIGHPAFKAMGAKTGYNYVNAVLVLLLGLFNGATVIMGLVPEVAGVGLLFWIGIVVTAGAFDRDETQQESSKSHAAAVALGLVPALAAWCLQNMQAVYRATASVLPGTLVEVDRAMSTPTGEPNKVIASIIGSAQGEHHPIVAFNLLADAVDSNGVFIYGMISLSRGYLLSSIYLASTLVHIIERNFLSAAAWMLLAAGLSFVGAVHSFEIDANGITSSYGFPARGPEEYPIQYAVSYSGAALLLVLFDIRETDRSWKGWLQHVTQCFSHPRICRKIVKGFKRVFHKKSHLHSKFDSSEVLDATETVGNSAHEGTPLLK